MINVEFRSLENVKRCFRITTVVKIFDKSSLTNAGDPANNSNG